jgi:membrane fusion protein, multidrug efflux system
MGKWVQDVRDDEMNGKKLGFPLGSTLIRAGAAEPRPSRFVIPNFTIKLRFRHALWAAAGLLLVAAAAFGGERYWTVGRFIESTDDAYVQAHSTTVAPKVAGYIAQVAVDDNQPVRRGQVLARIDDRDLQTALRQAEANLSAATAVVANLTAKLAEQQLRVREAQADLQVAQTAAELARINDARRLAMARIGYGSVEQSDDATTDLREKLARFMYAQEALAGSRQQIDVLRTQRDLAEAQRARAAAIRHQAELNLSYTVITAAIDGTVGARTVRIGQYVLPGTQLMEIVPLHHVYVVANFMETQLTRMRAGQRAQISVDAFPGDELTATVNSIAPASGLEFSLLPPDNATGNFTKIVQRVPVKLVFDDELGLSGRLRPGMSVEVSVDTRDYHRSVLTTRR